jgi:hypothetical protein
LNDGRRCGDLRLVWRRGGRLAIRWSSLLARRRHGGRAGLWLGHLRRLAGRLSGTLDMPQTLLELAIAVLQFLVLAGQLAQLGFKPLESRLGIVHLRPCLRTERQHSRKRCCPGKPVKSG